MQEQIGPVDAFISSMYSVIMRILSSRKLKLKRLEGSEYRSPPHTAFFFFFFFFFLLFRAVPTAYENSQASGQIGMTAASLHHSPSNAGSEPHLQPTS